MKQLLVVLLPSRYGIYITAVVAILATILLAAPGLLRDTGITGYLSLLEDGQVSSKVYGNYKDIRDNINSSRFAADSSTFIFWSVIGLMAYALVLSLKHVFDSAKELVEETWFARWARLDVWMSAVERFAIRMVAIVAWYFWLLLLFQVALPFAISVMSQISVINWPNGVALIGAILACNIIAVHISVVLLRLLLLRTRVLVGHTLMAGGHDG